MTNITADNGLVRQVARASVAIVSSYLWRDIATSVPEGLMVDDKYRAEAQTLLFDIQIMANHVNTSDPN